MDVFVSVGTALNPEQEAFVSAVEERLRAVGLNPCTIGRNQFSTKAPLDAVIELMNRCSGALVLALERYYFPSGVERRGSPKENLLNDTAFATSWNQIEAAMAYGRGLPLFVLVDEKVRGDGLLEKGHDWFVHALAVDPASLNGPAFTGLLKDWHDHVATGHEIAAGANAQNKPADPAGMTVAQLAGALRPAQLWTSLVALMGALVGAFALGMRLTGSS